jgi:hypothetical protein
MELIEKESIEEMGREEGKKYFDAEFVPNPNYPK